MNKSELIEQISAILGSSRRRADEVVNALLDGMVKALQQDQRIEIRGFGSFSCRHHGPRQTRHPSTGQLVQMAAKRTVYFRAGRQLREQVAATHQPQPAKSTPHAFGAADARSNTETGCGA